MINLKHILVATDFSDVADGALAYGRSLASSFGADLHLLHVAGDLSTANFGAEGYVMNLSDLQQEVEDSAHKQLDSRAAGSKPPARGILMISNRPAETIVEYARGARIDLIIMGTQGRGGMSRLLMGSVAERVVRTAPCPVMTVHHPEHEFLQPDVTTVAARA